MCVKGAMGLTQKRRSCLRAAKRVHTSLPANWLQECGRKTTVTQEGIKITHVLAGVSNLLASLGHTGRRRVVLGHTLNTLQHVIMHTQNLIMVYVNLWFCVGLHSQPPWAICWIPLSSVWGLCSVTPRRSRGNSEKRVRAQGGFPDGRPGLPRYCEGFGGSRKGAFIESVRGCMEPCGVRGLVVGALPSYGDRGQQDGGMTMRSILKVA